MSGCLLLISRLPQAECYLEARARDCCSRRCGDLPAVQNDRQLAARGYDRTQEVLNSLRY